METKQLVTNFLDSLKSIGRSESTIVAYKKDIEQLMDFLDNSAKKTIDLVSTNDLQAYVEELKKNGDYTLKTVSRKINSLKTYYKYLLNKKIVADNVAKPIEHPAVSAQLPRILSPMEYRALRDAARLNLRIYTMIEILLQTGMRIGEISRLQREDIHFKSDPAYLIVKEFSSNPERKVELNDAAVSALRQYMVLEHPSKTTRDYLFETKSGNPILIRNIRTALNRVFKKAGIRSATVNDIRNTFIVFQLENGLRIDRLAEVVGHQKTTTTEKYYQLVQRKPKKTTNRVLPL